MSLLRAMLWHIARSGSDAPTRRYLGSVAVAAHRELCRRERVRKLWSDPLTLFPYDPVRLSVIQFNDGRGERSLELRKGIEELRSALPDLRRRLAGDSLLEGA